ncbi:reverse transcriptase family protein [Planctobacterium marinum]|uniref:reverse transcriptase family protein n=1 Tax=Planctobacterium marinum TaxID=1631968 RepID=UPI001E3AAD92|nr:reverse transcriptase family protein [Planctobacterium marinum]MCC2607334.1 reverse transcriptase family protein [Planctobacterium marinum]
MPEKRQFIEVFRSTFHEKISQEELITLETENEYKIFQHKSRKTYAPTPKLKNIHRFLNNTVFEYADYNKEVVFSYRKGKSVREAVELHAGSKIFFQTDISNFYGSITRENVEHSLREQLNNVPISDIKEYIPLILKLVVVDNHIPAGFSTSPVLSNICLYEFDNALQVHCENNGLIYSRYSDDIIISGESSEFVDRVTKTTEDLLHKYINTNVSLNPDKTKVHKKGRYFRLLGFTILPDGKITIPSQDKKEIETSLYFYLTDSSKFVDLFTKTNQVALNEVDSVSIRERAIASLSGKLIGVNSMDKNYISKLRGKYGNTVIDMFIRKAAK